MRAQATQHALRDLQGCVADHFRRAREVHEPAERHRVLHARCSAERPRLEPRLQRVDLGLQFRDLLRERLAVVQHRTVRQVHRDLAHVLHQHDRVHRALQVRDRGLDLRRALVPVTGRALGHLGHPVVRPAQHEDVPGLEERVPIRVQQPIPPARATVRGVARPRRPRVSVVGTLGAAADRDDANARLRRQVDVAERPAGVRRVRGERRPCRRLDRLRQHRPQRVR